MAILYDLNTKEERGLLPGYCSHWNTVALAVLTPGWQEQGTHMALQRGPVRGWATWTLPKKYFQGSYLLFLKLKPILEGSPKTPDTKQVLWGTKAPP